MAILEIREETSSDNISRQIEIKTILSELTIGKEALVQIDCTINAYRVSFNRYCKQYNEECAAASTDWIDKKFAIIATDNPKQWIIRRIGKLEVEHQESESTEETSIQE